jgi:hypothetical protein
MIPDKIKCPRCGSLLPACGSVEVSGDTFPVFQCAACIEPVELFGVAVDVAFSFAVDRLGRPFMLTHETLDP